MRRLLIIGLLAAIAVLALGATANAGVSQPCVPGGYPPCDPGVIITADPSGVGGISAGTAGVAGARANLPYTGSSSSTPWVVIGGGLVLLGVALTVAGYRRHTAQLHS